MAKHFAALQCAPMDPTRTPRYGWQRHLAMACFLGALSAAAWQLPKPEKPAFALPASPATDLPPVVLASAPAETGDTARMPSLAELADGRIALAWISGPDNRPEREAIWFSRLGRQGWQKPVAIASHESAAGDSFAHIRHVDRPLLTADDDSLYLWFLSGGLGTAAVNLLNAQISGDGGEHWQRARWLQPQVAGIGQIDLASPPRPLEDGGFALLTGSARPGRGVHWIRVGANGRVIDTSRLPASSNGLGPAWIATSASQAWAIISQPDDAPSTLFQSLDGGLHWQESGQNLPMLASKLSPALLRLGDGRLLLAGNPATDPGSLKLWLGDAQAGNWHEVKTIESAPDGAASFTQPSLLLGRDGRIHLAYAWRGRQIKYLTFSTAWLTGEHS